MKLSSLLIACGVLSGCQLFAAKSQLKSNVGEQSEKQLAETIALGMSYPYERESGSYLFVNGDAYPYEYIGKDPLGDSTLRVGGKVIQVDTFLKDAGRSKNSLKVQPMTTRTPIIAYGSNAAVSALKRKFMSEKFPRGWAVIPVLKGTIKDFEVIHAAHFVPVNGSFPAGLQYTSGSESEVWITFLDELEMERMHASEGIDSDSPESWYSYGKLENVKIQLNGWRSLTSAFVYVDNYGALKVNDKTAALAKVPSNARSPKLTMQDALESAEDIFEKVPASAESAERCKKWSGVEKRLCENIVDNCARDERTEALAAQKRTEFWKLPEGSGISYTRLAGSDKAGHPKAFPDSMRCARAGR
ncbi:MAG: hypothetical protein RL189_2656 [Pseudomonadota bacterium]|jgi:hypothetical protein